MRVVFLGAPGAGKGTQAKCVGRYLKVPQISSGDMLRAAVRIGSPLGRQAQTFMDEGQLVPDSLMVALILERIRKSDCNDGFILDGFPRTQEQANSLENSLKAAQKPLDRVIDLHIDKEVLIQRLLGRRVCPKGHGEWHLRFRPPPEPGVCPQCGATLVHRDDDQRDTIETRLQAYQASTAPLVAFYKQRGILCQVEADGDIAMVTRHIQKVICT